MIAEIIVNPASGSYDKEKIDKCAEIIRNKAGDVVITHTQWPNHATQLASGSKADIVIAAGGDGLVNEVAAGISGRKTLFAVLPFGTVNVLCREYKIPLDPVKAANALNLSVREKLPLGYLGERPFIIMCGVGFDASVVKRVTEKKYKKHKTLAHIKEGLLALSDEYPKLTMHANGMVYELYHGIISLSRCYAGNFTLSKNIKTDALNVFINQKSGMRPLLGSVLSMIAGRGFPGRAIYTNTVKISGTSYFQLDGEFIDTGSTQNYISIKKNAVTFVH